jgi:hypothetical protein
MVKDDKGPANLMDTGSSAHMESVKTVLINVKHCGDLNTQII